MMTPQRAIKAFLDCHVLASDEPLHPADSRISCMTDVAPLSTTRLCDALLHITQKKWLCEIFPAASVLQHHVISCVAELQHSSCG